MKNHLDFLKTTWQNGKLHSFYHIRSLGDLQLTPHLSKRVFVAYKRSNASEDLPKTFYMVEENGSAKFYSCLVTIIIEHSLYKKGSPNNVP